MKSASPEDVRFVCDLLLKELHYCRDDSRVTDANLLRMMTMLLMPFLVLLAYVLFNDRYFRGVLAVPFVTLFGVMLLASIVMRYHINAVYGHFIETQINGLLGARFLVAEDLSSRFYGQGWNLVTSGAVIILTGGLLVNSMLVRFINSQIQAEALQNDFPFRFSVTAYWSSVGAFCVYVTVAVLFQFTRRKRDCLRAAREFQSQIAAQVLPVLGTLLDTQSAFLQERS